MKITGAGMGAPMWSKQSAMKNNDMNKQKKPESSPHQDRLVLSPQARIQQSQNEVTIKEPAENEIRVDQYVETHQDRIDRIKKAIQENNYHVSDEQVADAVVQRAAEWRSRSVEE